MSVMGRHRRANLNLPPRMRFSDGGYYFDSYGPGLPRKWIFLGRDFNAARVAWANKINDGDTELFQSLHDKFMAECTGTLSAGTKNVYTYAGGVLCGTFGKMKLREITAVNIGSYLDTHPKPSSANTQIGLMGRMFEKGMRWGWCTVNPCLGISRNKLKKRDRYIDHIEFDAVRSVAPQWLQVAMNLSYLTSMSEDSVLQLKLPDLSDEGIYTRRKKNGKRQIFEWTDDIRAVITMAKSLPRPISSIFVIARKKDGQPIKANTLQVAMQTACAKAGITDFHFHDIRAKAATDAERDGQDYFRMLGHAHRSMSDQYVKARKIDRVKSGLSIVGTLQKTGEKPI